MNDKKASSLDIEHATNMANSMKALNEDITVEINKTKEANWGVVALKFANKGRSVQIEVLDEPYEPNVRMYPGE